MISIVGKGKNQNGHARSRDTCGATAQERVFGKKVLLGEKVYSKDGCLEEKASRRAQIANKQTTRPGVESRGKKDFKKGGGILEGEGWGDLPEAQKGKRKKNSQKRGGKRWVLRNGALGRPEAPV